MGKLKVKIESRWSNLPMTDIDEIVYDIYYGFTGMPTTLPFYTKWKIDKAGLTKEELFKWFEKNVLAYQDVIIKF